jgi:CRP-like cAMP-binding protein
MVTLLDCRQTITPSAGIVEACSGGIQILSGWLGLVSFKKSEPRLFEVLLPGDRLPNDITAERFYAVALTSVSLSNCEALDGGLASRLMRHCFRLSQFDARERMADFLLDIARRLPMAGRDTRWSYQLPLSQSQLGEILGMSAVQVSRSLKQLQAEGLIKQSHRKITILEPEKIAATVGLTLHAFSDATF